MFRTALFEISFQNDGDFWFIEHMRTPAERGRGFMTLPHYQDTAEFVLTNGITGSACVNGRNITLSAETIIYAPPGHVHSMTYESGDGEILCAKIDTGILSEYLDLKAVLDADGISLESCSAPDDIDAYDRIHKIITRAENCRFLSGRISAALDLITALDRGSPDVRTPRRTDELRGIIDWTENEWKNGITLDTAAARFGYSKNHFCEKFRRMSGITYIDYINHLRISSACRMLSRGDTLSKVCAECGFSNQSYFIRLFSKIMGMTPAKYRIAHTDGTRI